MPIGKYGNSKGINKLPIEKYRITNLSRILIAVLDLILILLGNVEYNFFIFVAIIHLIFSMIWFFMIESELLIEKDHKWSGYFPAIIDITAATSIIQLTGNIHSYLVSGYYIVTAIGSMHSEKHFGLSLMIICFLQYTVTGILVYLNIIPNLNIFFSGFFYLILMSILISAFYMLAGLLAVNKIINKFVLKSIELTEKAEREKEKSERLLSNIRQDLNFAKKIQKKLLPYSSYKFESININSLYLPMVEVGGDIFDFYPIDKNKVRVFLADATGHGVEAALITMLIKSELESLKQQSLSPGQLLQVLNDTFYNKYNSLSFFFSCFVVDINLQKRELVYSSAGHPEQYLIDSENFSFLKNKGILIGVKNNQTFAESILPFPIGTKLLLFTDGLYEEFNEKEEEFGEDRIISIIKSKQNQSINDIIHNLELNLKSFLKETPYQDDITIIGIE